MAHLHVTWGKSTTVKEVRQQKYGRIILYVGVTAMLLLTGGLGGDTARKLHPNPDELELLKPPAQNNPFKRIIDTPGAVIKWQRKQKSTIVIKGYDKFRVI